MSALFAAVCSIAPTRRRRFLWAVWWTGAPTREAFRKPDAFQGGARTREEAFAEAESVAGVRLVEIEPRWARAWGRVLVGQAPWIERRGGGVEGAARTSDASSGSPRATRGETPRASVWAILQVTPQASQAELKRAFRMRALETHPDSRGYRGVFSRRPARL